MLVFPAISGLVFVALGALGGHVLSNTLSANEMAWVRTAMEYQGFHTLNITGVGRELCWRSALFLFSGSLYFLVLLHLQICVYITPVGGVCFLIV
ncbi:MAG: DUF423 domain-containing protein [Serratia symbiotica]|nr:DUF423 domain-containing protein [Serratia symbiotica]